MPSKRPDAEQSALRRCRRHAFVGRKLAERVSSLRETEKKYHTVYDELQDTTTQLQNALRRAVAAEAEAAILATGQDADAAKAVLVETERKMKEQQDELTKSLGARMKRDVERNHKEMNEMKKRAVEAERRAGSLAEQLSDAQKALLQARATVTTASQQESKRRSSIPFLFKQDST